MSGADLARAGRIAAIEGLAARRARQRADDHLTAARRLEALAGGAAVLAEAADGPGGELARDALRPFLELLHRDARDLAEALDG